ncbi:hypothetical protein CEXT_353501 [Caerostris extrusa]|uniref:Uncharacterized protein n=1 Tax=Caerostris extrusa TaxID=172846 RepID=A0AAV4QME5_CAEEX|nr:hypothetical protein CEXT_353501 [Caerostris extrusa]
MPFPLCTQTIELMPGASRARGVISAPIKIKVTIKLMPRSSRARSNFCPIKIRVVRANHELVDVICGLFFLINAAALPPLQKSDKKRYAE